MNTKLWIGSYSSPSGDGIYSFELNNETGQLSLVGKPVQAINPSYLTFGSDKKYLYAVIETLTFKGANGGGVAAYKIRNNGELEFINAEPTTGCDPCYLCVDSNNTFLVTANYTSGSFTVFPLGENGEILPYQTVVRHQGSGPDKERQEAAHVHFTAFTPDEKYLCAVDLGSDCVEFYRWDDRMRARASLRAEDSMTIALRLGSGPRHLVFCGRFLYLVTELSSEVTVFEYTGDRYHLRQTISALPSDFQGYSAAAAIRLAPDGRFLYTSNRGHDSIAIFRIGDDGLLSLSGITSSRGKWPRDIAIEPHGNFLIAANERSNELTVFQIDKASGTLTKVDCTVVHKPTCILFQ